MDLCGPLFDAVGRRCWAAALCALREVFNGLRWIVRTGTSWRMMPHDLPPCYIVYQQTQRWLAAGCFEAIVDDLRLLLRGVKGRKGQPSAAIFDSCTLPSTEDKWGASRL